MKKNIYAQMLAGLLLILAGLYSCKKEIPEIKLDANRDFSKKAMIKVYNSTVNATRNYVYVDNIPITGAGMVYSTSPLFPSSSYYSAIDAGSRTILIKDTLATATQKPISFTSNFDAGANYTIFTYDTLNNPKYLLVKDNITTPADTSSRLRFANLIYNRTALPNIDIYSAKLKQTIFTNVPQAEVTDFISYQSGLGDTLFVRSTGTTTNLAQLNSFNPTRKRSYTIVFRGHYPTTASTNTLARSLTQFNNY